MTPQSSAIGALCRIYSVLMYAYPRDFRRQYGVEMEQVFRDRWRDAARIPGRWRMLRLALGLAADWAGTAARERASAIWAALRLVDAAGAIETGRPDALHARVGIATGLVLVGDLLGSDDGSFELAESRQAIAESWRSLSDLERQVLTLRLVNNMTQREIGDAIGYSQMHVSRLLRRSLKRLGDAADPV